MKDINDLFSRFSQIEDLPISEEIIGAFVEGKLSDGESSAVSEIVNQDIFLMNLVSDTQEEVLGFETPEPFFEDEVIDFNSIDIFNNEIDEFDNIHIHQDEWSVAEDTPFDEWSEFDDSSISENSESFNDIDE